MPGRFRRIAAAVVVIALCAVELCGAEAAPPHPGRFAVAGPGRSAELLHVKLRDGVPVRARAGSLVRIGDGDLNGRLADSIDQLRAEGLTFEPEFGVLPEARLDALRARASRARGRPTADLNLHMVVRVPAGVDRGSLIRRLGALDCVERVSEAPIPIAPPLPPDFTSSQTYRSAAPFGIGVTSVSGLPGGSGIGVAFADVEYSWNSAHADLPGVTLLGAAPVDPFNDLNHGTAVLGQLIGKPNGFGVTGMAHGASPYFVAANTASGYSVGAAVLVAASALAPGSVILIEQQTAGPSYTGFPAGTQFGLVPVEWNLSTYDAIVAAVGSGMIVVEAAGNGAQNLDDPVYSIGNGGHFPFRPENDSGAIIVGAGAWGGSGSARSRLSFSCYGSTVDLQGWGEQVTTAGYGGLYSSEGPNQYYTAGFSGTSSASPIVAAACILLQAHARATTGITLSPQEVRDLLVSTGSAQTGAAQHIGPLPNLAAAFSAFSPAPPGSFDLLAPSEGATGVSANPEFVWSEATLAGAYDITIDDDADFSSPVWSWNLLGTSYFYGGPALAPGGTYYWMVTCTNNLGTTAGSPESRSFTVAVPPPGGFQLSTPLDGATVNTRMPVLAWTASVGAATYRVEIDDDSDFASPVLAQSGIAATSFKVSGGVLSNHEVYRWRVFAEGGGGQTLGTPGLRAFSVEAPPCAGDANQSSTVDFSDVTSVLVNFGAASPPGSESPGDANQDGVVNFVDVTTVLVNWGSACP